jgi:hypothetical protein
MSESRKQQSRKLEHAAAKRRAKALRDWEKKIRAGGK